MSPKKKNTASGVITLHTHFPTSLWKSEECMADVRSRRGSPSQPSARTRSVRAGKKRDEASSSSSSSSSSASGSQPGSRQDRLSRSSLRRLQAKMEAENQQAKEIIQPLLDTENGFVKELERFLSHRDVTELRRRELLHKRWTERVWFPLQRRVEEHASTCTPAEAKRRQSLYRDYLHHCNTKGFVFLETYDLKEYNPFLLNIKKQHYFKDPLCLQLHERLKGKRTARSCEEGCKYKLPQSDRPLSESGTSQADTLLQASSNYPGSTSGRTPVEEETEGRTSSRVDTIPYHITATATPDGRCHRAGCWLSRCGGRQQPASLQQPTSK